MGNNTSIVQSDIAKILNRDDIAANTCWCVHLYCCGEGLNMDEPLSDPWFAGDGKELCIRGGSACTWDIMGTAGGKDKEDGLCSGLTVCLCLTSHMQIPPLEGAPKCTCINKPLLQGGANLQRKSKILPYEDVFKDGGDTWWLYYCFCIGMGFQVPGSGNLPLYGADSKNLCTRGYSKLEEFENEGRYFASMARECCLYSQCELMPKATGFVRICGKKGSDNCKFFS